MKLIAFIEGKVKPQPRTTQNVKFLFRETVDYWRKVDAQNAEKAKLGMINKRGKPYKETRYAYRLERMQKTNEYRENFFEVVNSACKGKIPTQNLFFFYLFHVPKNLSKKKELALVWTPHLLRPDVKNTYTLSEDALYKEDSMLTGIALYKMYVPRDTPAGVLILQDDEIHNFIIETAIENYLKPRNY